MEEQVFDIFVIGGGVNGTSVARDAAGRGLSVCLCEKDDLASHTSSASTKLIHGGLRYLEHYEFKLVREALSEREVILRSAPHIVWPLRFVLPHAKGLRPRWMLRAGLFLYDNIGKRKLLPGTETIKFSNHISGKPLKDEFKHGFVYSDAWVMDARMVMLNAKSAANNGALINTRTEVLSAKRVDDNKKWEIRILDKNTGNEQTYFAKVLINAAGPWVSSILDKDKVDFHTKESVRLVQGSHIVVPKIFDHSYCYIFQNPDGRIIFAIPYEDDFTLIGTTDVDYKGNPDDVKCSDTEKEYLVKAASEYFKKEVKPTDIIWDYSGVRPLYDDGSKKAQKATRDFVLSLDTPHDNADGAIMNIFGGKITAARELGERVMEKIAPLFGNSHGNWTQDEILPGGDMGLDFEKYLKNFQEEYPWLDDAMAYHYVRHYGSEAHKIIGNAKSKNDLGLYMGDICYEAELRYSKDNEWSQCAEDFLWRRTKKGLYFSEETITNISGWFEH
ncbi:MAG: glycerol-3-phosphate dehydrogenase [Alphaproteobacteria bacterium]